MRTLVVFLTVLTLGVSLAGCSDDAAATDDVLVVESGAVAEVQSDDKPVASGNGWIEGFVVDETITPVAGAKIALPGMDQSRTSGKDGSFAFGNLVPGPYFIEADAVGYEALEATVNVAEGTTKVRIVLTRLPSEDPFTTSQKFAGFQDIVLDPITGTSQATCTTCVFTLRLDAYPDHMVVEAWRENDSPDPSGLFEDQRMRGILTDGRGAELYREYGPDPFVRHVLGPQIAGQSVFKVEMYPMSGAVPETNVDFEVVVTTFHHFVPSLNWSSSGGSA